MLEAVAHFNNLSTKLRSELEKEISDLLELSPRVHYKFNISHDNPDPEKINGPVIWPSLFNLPQAVFDIVDPYDPGKKKKIALVKGTDDKGIPNDFDKIRIAENDTGNVYLSLDKMEDHDKFAYLALHPRNGGGRFQDKHILPIFYRVDEAREAKERSVQRNLKRDAIVAAGKLKDSEVKDFAAAMAWDETQDIGILRDKIESMAENDPNSFAALINAGSMSHRATIKRAFDKQILIYHPAEHKVTFAASGQVVVILERDGSGKNEVEQAADALAYNPKGEEMYKVIKKLVDAQYAS